MEKPFEAEEGPNKPSVTYILQCMQKDTDYEFYFECLVEELKLEGCRKSDVSRVTSQRKTKGGL